MLSTHQMSEIARLEPLCAAFWPYSHADAFVCEAKGLQTCKCLSNSEDLNVLLYSDHLQSLLETETTSDIVRDCKGWIPDLLALVCHPMLLTACPCSERSAVAARLSSYYFAIAPSLTLGLFCQKSLPCCAAKGCMVLAALMPAQSCHQ